MDRGRSHSANAPVRLTDQQIERTATVAYNRTDFRAAPRSIRAHRMLFIGMCLQSIVPLGREAQVEMVREIRYGD